MLFTLSLRLLTCLVLLLLDVGDALLLPVVGFALLLPVVGFALVLPAAGFALSLLFILSLLLLGILFWFT